MKQTLLLLIVVVLTAAACGPSPRDRAKEFTEYLPAEYGEWEQLDDETVELLTSTVTSMGHVIMQYEGPNDALAYIVIEAHPSNDAADVAATNRLRELQLQGLVLDRNRAPQKATADVAQSDVARYALFNEDGIVVEINALADEDGVIADDEVFEELLDIVRNAYDRAVE